MSKIDLNQQARDEMLKILDKMIMEREHGMCDKQYKTLTDSFERFFNMDRDFYNTHSHIFNSYSMTSIAVVEDVIKNFNESNNNFYILLSSSLEEEINELIKVLSIMLHDGDYKGHHNWSISYEKVSRVYFTIDKFINYKN